MIFPIAVPSAENKLDALKNAAVARAAYNSALAELKLVMVANPTDIQCVLLDIAAMGLAVRIAAKDYDTDSITLEDLQRLEDGLSPKS